MTEIDIKQYVDTMVDALRREMDQRQMMNTNARDAALHALDIRLQGMNEFRDQINTERVQYVRWDTFMWVIGTLFLGMVGIAVTLLVRIVKAL